MKNFIEITEGKRKVLLNIQHIVLVQPNLSKSDYDKADNTCLIDVSNRTDIRIHALETYDKVKELIEQASK